MSYLRPKTVEVLTSASIRHNGTAVNSDANTATDSQPNPDRSGGTVTSPPKINNSSEISTSEAEHGNKQNGTIANVVVAAKGDNARSSGHPGLQAPCDHPTSITSPVQGVPGTPRSVAFDTSTAAQTEAGQVQPKQQQPAQKVSVAEICRTVVGDFAGAGKQAANSGRCLFMALMDRKKPMNITLDELLGLAFFIGVALQLLLLKLMSPSALTIAVFTLVGLGVGLALSFLYYHNKKEKAEVNQMLSMVLGIKGLQHLVGKLPSWLSFTKQEKVEWMNQALVEMWPYVDRAVCKHLKTMLESVFETTLKTQKVPIKSVQFKQLTFGDAPFRIESIYVDEENLDSMEMEVGVRWCGEANITLAIELTGAGGDLLKICPQVSDISFVSVVRVRLAPLIREIPGFAALMMTLTKPPRFKYNLNFGKALGGSYVAGVVQPFIDNTVKCQLVNMLVWPQRMVIPMLANPSKEMELVIKRMDFQHRGLLRIDVLRAENLTAADLGGKSDPLVELSTDGGYLAETRVIKNNLNPVWEETHWLLVQEPTSQEMKVVVSDRDMFSAADFIKLKMKAAFGSKEMIGRTLVKLAPVARQEPLPVTQQYHLGMGQWSDPEGCGKGCGKIELRMSYRSFCNIQPHEVMDAEQGIVVCKVYTCKGMSSSKLPMTIYCTFTCDGKAHMTSPVTTSDGHDHVFKYRTIKEFYNVRFDKDVKIQVFEKAISDDECGVIEMPVMDIMKACDINASTGKPEAGHMHTTLKLEDADRGHIELSLRFLPCKADV